MHNIVSYTKVADRRLLRFALWQAWGMKCYWCDTPKAYLEVEIDHIVPKGLGKAELKKALEDYDLPQTFDIHSPKNLAPICDPCNGAGRKGSRSYGRAAVVLNHLLKAASLEGKVARTIQEFKNGGDIAKAFLALASSDSNSPGVRDLYKEYFSAVASTAATIDPTLVQMPVYKELDIDCGYPARLDLEPRFAREFWLLDDFLDSDLEEALDRPLHSLMGEMTIAMEADLQKASEYEPLDVGPPTPYAFDVRVVEIRFPRKAVDTEMEVELVLRCEGGLTSSVSRYSDDGSERLDLQGEAAVSGTVLIHGTWSIDEGLLLSEDVTLENDFTLDSWLE